MKTFQRIVKYAVIALIGAIVAKELRKPERDRHGTVAGIPYDFRRPSWQRIKASVWDPSNPKLITARPFGVGWSVNVARLLRRAA